MSYVKYGAQVTAVVPSGSRLPKEDVSRANNPGIQEEVPLVAGPSVPDIEQGGEPEAPAASLDRATDPGHFLEDS